MILTLRLMILGLISVLSLSLGITQANLAYARIVCTLPQPPTIEVIPKTAPIQYEFTKSVTDLLDIQTNTVSPYGTHKEQMMLGLHEGQIHIQMKTTLKGTEYKKHNMGCLYFDHVSLTIALNPKIYVIREFPPRSCAHKVVLDHEYKHVEVDRRIVNIYAQRIGDALAQTVNHIGAVGPFPLQDLPAIQESMVKDLHAQLQSWEKDMVADQLRNQQAVDSLEEYERIGRALREDCRYDIEGRLGRKVADSLRRKR